MVRLGVATVEFKFSCRIVHDNDPVFVRLVASNPTGFVLKIDKYYECNVDDAHSRTVFRAITDDVLANGPYSDVAREYNHTDPEKTRHPNSHTHYKLGPWHNMDVSFPYETTQKFERQRAEAMSTSDTLYVYDWPVLFEHGVHQLWEEIRRQRMNGSSLSANGSQAHKAPIDPASSPTFAAIRKAITPSRSTGSFSASNKLSPDPFASGPLFTCMELILCDAETHEPLPKGWLAHAEAAQNSVILPVHREAGKNDVGMVAWIMKLRTPECQSQAQGREIVVIANDITFQAGSFGTKEDLLFFKASEYARIRGIPRLFLAANSGARIGMAQSLKSKFRICWSDESDPSRGFKYIYLTTHDYNELLAKADGNVKNLPVVCVPVSRPDGGEVVHYQITDIIGEEPDLGVENLMGSGLIAGETARAYDQIFTLTCVVARTVGIGAYLVRLGQRTIQKTRNCPIILTGYQALNKLMGREIYTTNDQLGGPMIMFPNGVTHLLADTHMDTVLQALKWLAYVPAKRGDMLPILDITGLDTIARSVEFAPPKGLPYDPRLVICDWLS
jgi:hypothetical protein